MPIRNKPIKWDGKHEKGRYKNVDGYKYDVLKQTVVHETEEMPAYFIADTQEEAEKLYEDYSKILNGLSYTYSQSTGIEKSDLFGEALIGLGRAYRDFDPKRSNNFKNFAILKIKDALNEYTRKNSTSISVPAYIKNANSKINKLKELLNKDYIGDLNNLPKNENIEKLIKLLENIAERAGIETSKLLERAEFIPSNVIYDDNYITNFSNQVEEETEKILMVRQLLDSMDETERAIAEGIMNGKTYEEIAQEHNKTAPWVIYKIKKFKERLSLDNL
jgi:RNA polymerase sigma factor (sigma-70 family)